MTKQKIQKLLLGVAAIISVCLLWPKVSTYIPSWDVSNWLAKTASGEPSCPDTAVTYITARKTEIVIGPKSCSNWLAIPQSVSYRISAPHNSIEVCFATNNCEDAGQYSPNGKKYLGITKEILAIKNLESKEIQVTITIEGLNSD